MTHAKSISIPKVRIYPVLLGLSALHLAAFLGCLLCLSLRGFAFERGSLLAVLVTALFLADGSYITCRNLRGNRILILFSLLLATHAWQLLSIYIPLPSSLKQAALMLLPFCTCLSACFLAIFLLQNSLATRDRRLLALPVLLCLLTCLALPFSRRAFFLLYLIQFLLSAIVLCLLLFRYRKRVAFVLKSQKRQFLLSLLLVVLPALAYVLFFFRQSAYLGNSGTLLFSLAAFFSVHSIIDEAMTADSSSFRPALGLPARCLLAALVCLLLVLLLISGIPALALLILLCCFLLLWQVLSLLQFLERKKHPRDPAFALLVQEEKLRLSFSSYLHDQILQDILAAGHLLPRSSDRSVHALLTRTLSDLTVSIRREMERLSPSVLPSLSARENLRLAVEDIQRSFPASGCQFQVDCQETAFLPEPYSHAVLRFARELCTNVQKYAQADSCRLSLTGDGEEITLTVSDNGRGMPASALAPRTGHGGLGAIKAQVEALGGTFSLESPRPFPEPGGTRITITLPVKGEISYESFIH